jgi:hypothetical protein
MLHVCHKHDTVTQGLLGCRKCRRERIDNIVKESTAAYAEEVKRIFSRVDTPPASPAHREE